MIECIANKIENGCAVESIRFVVKGDFVVLKNGNLIAIPEDFCEDAKSLFGEEFDRIAEYRTFYNKNTKKFKLLEYNKNIKISNKYIPISEEGGEVDGWVIKQLKNENKI